MAWRDSLFRNNGDGTFTDVILGSGIRGDGNTQGATWGDFDNDGWMDLFVMTKVKAGISGNAFVCGDRLTAADVTAVPYVYLATFEVPENPGPVVGFFGEHFDIGEGREATRAWVRRVMAHDVGHGGL